jgi:hypothetical protein
MKKTTNENEKTFSDLTGKSWFIDGPNIKVGDNISKFISNEFQTLEVKELLNGDTYKT